MRPDRREATQPVAANTANTAENQRAAVGPALGQLRISYPGIGPVFGRSFGHPEAVTLPRAFPELRECQNMVFGDRPTLAVLSALRWAIDHRLLTIDRAARLAGRVERLTAAGSNILRTGGAPPLFALASGTYRGERAIVATALTQLPGLSMAANTAVPLAVATPLVKFANRPGVHTPETLLDPDAFFGAFAGHCIGDPPAGAMPATTKSWASPADNAAVLGSYLLTALLQRQ